MDAGFKARWVEALRSGRYTQTIGQLMRTSDAQVQVQRDSGPVTLVAGVGFCCLGVACDIDKGDIGGEWDEFDHFLWNNEYENSDCDTMPDEYLMERWGLFGATADDLASMNDGGKTFAEIADYIEEYL